MNDNLLLRLTSKYNLISIISFSNYNHILKLIKYNKKLQKKLNITEKNYFINYVYKKESKRDISVSFSYFHESVIKKLALICFIIQIILFTSQFIFFLIFLYKSPYTIFDIGKKKYDLIYGFFAFLNYIFILYNTFSIFLFLYIYNEDKNKNTPIVLIINTIIYSFIACMLSWIFSIIFDIENKKFNIITIVLIIILGLYFLVLLFSIIIIKLHFDFSYNVEVNYSLIKLEGIDINYSIDNNFLKNNLIGKKYYILDHLDYITYTTTENENIIFNSINNIRENYQLPKLMLVKTLPLFIIKKNIEVEMTFNNYIRLEDKKHLFRYPKGEFLNKLEQKDKIIINIITIGHLNKIKIFIKDNLQYILIYNDLSKIIRYNNNINNNINNINNNNINNNITPIDSKNLLTINNC